MKMLKRGIAFCLVIMLLAGVAFNNSSLIGGQVEAADMTETGETEAAAAEASALTAEPTADTPSVLSETGTETPSAETPAEQSAAEAPAEQPAAVTESTPESVPAADTPSSESAAAGQNTADTPAATPAPEVKKQEAMELKQEVKEETTAASEEEKKEESELKPEVAEEDNMLTGKTEEAEEAQEEELNSLNFENDDVTITVSEVEAGAIPEGAELKVVPILADDKDTEDQYKEVEEQIQKKAKEDEKEIKGFLAYDITFVDADGNEVEPNSEVKVTMEYKEPALPAWKTTMETKDMEVSVLHLEEDEDGNVKEVVDMNDAGQVNALETGNEQQVQKVELRTESFSSFVIYWGNNKNKITIYYVDQYGNSIPNVNIQDNEIFVDNGESVEFANYKDYVTDNSYTYMRAHLDSYDGTIAKSVKYSSGKDTKWTYRTESNNDEHWEISDNERKVYLVYEKEDALTTVDTVDNATAGITMRMTNYDSAADGLSDDIGGGYGDGYVKQNLLKPNLQNGYPVTTGNKSLAKLFNGGTTVNHLFIQDTYDETGYYEYSSFDNYAYLGSGTDFTVYEQLGTPSDETGDDKFFYQRGNFMPYNKIEAGMFSVNRNLYDEDGSKLNEADPRYNEQLYKTQGTDYYFGMYMEVNFLQPKDGYAVHNETSNPMIYEFNGDDDLWVYIDDVLVLDIGGIHDAHSGYINFATGDVHVECIDGSGGNQDTTIKAMYWAAKKFPDGTQWTKWDDSKVDQFFEGNTFRDYTNHTLKMFYMERGAGASNLHMKFNLQTVPSGAIEVTKELSNTDKEKYANVQFAFQVYAQKITSHDTEGNEIYSENDYVTLNDAVKKDTVEKINFVPREIINEELYENVFYLKPGETAQFNDLQNNRKYYVREIGVKTNEYDKVIINGTEIINFGEAGEITSSIKNIESSKEEVYKRPAVVFENNCSALNSRELWITKQMDGTQTTTDTFDFCVQLSDQNGTLTNYTGSYYLMKDGNYYYYDENGNLQNNGTTSKICGTANNGVIENVDVGYSVKLTGILSGTKYKVWEVDPNTGLSEEKYNDPVYVTDDTDAVSDEYGTYTSGEIELGKNVDITVKNALLSSEDQPMIRVQKTFEGLTEEAIAALVDFSITVKNASGEDVAILKLGDGNSEAKMAGVAIVGPSDSGEAPNITYTWEILNVEAGVYTVSETGTDTAGYELTSTTINGKSGATVTTQTPSFSAHEIGWITSQSTTKYNINQVDVIVISLTDTATTEYIVWSADKLSVGEREGLQQAVATAGQGQFGGSNFGTSAKISFFSSRQLIEKGFYFRGKISVDSDNNLVFEGGKHQWNMIWLGSYKRTGAVDAEIEIVNTYQPATMDVDLKKFGTDYKIELANAEFELYSGTKASGEAHITWGDEPIKSVTVQNTDTATAIELTDLATGYYKLKEVKAPAGYQLLDSDIYFKVDTAMDSLSIINDKGEEISNTANLMWQLDPKGSKQIQIKNKALYDLPSSGGPGIYWYTIGGMLLMMAGSLILYKNKRREVLERK